MRSSPIVVPLLALVIVATPALAWAASDQEPTTPPRPADVILMDTAYRFDAEGLVSLADTALLPVPRGSVSAHWYELDGWTAVVFEGLDLLESGPLCLGTATIDPASGLLTQASFASTTEGGCDDAGAGSVPLATSDTGVRACGDVVVYVTRIPVESGGPLIANLVAFLGDGTGVGLSSRLESPSLDRTLDPSLVDCGPLPPVRVPVPATPMPELTPVITPAPSRAGVLPREQRDAAPTPSPREACPPASGPGLLDMHRSSVGPYLMRQPTEARADVATIVFLPGGRGSFDIAQRAWETFFSSGRGFEEFRIVLPYALDGELIDQALRTFAILDEVLWCYGGDPMQVHLAGSSNGGLAAFGLMARQPERFATLLGAPGAFPVQDPTSVDPEVWLDLLAGRAVFNGVGEFDAEWLPEVLATHNALTEAGIESTFVELPRQGHTPGPGFDSSILLEFWESHP